MTIYVRSYGLSTTALNLARALKTVRIMPCPPKIMTDIREENFIRQPGDVIINWGNSHDKEYLFYGLVLNLPPCVKRAVNKLSAFNILLKNEIPHLHWTVSKDEAQIWLDSGHKVFCRGLLASSQGKGITVCYSGDELPDVKMYTKGEEIKREYRVHVMRGELVDLAAKALKKGGEHTDIKNCAHGYIYARNAVKTPDELRERLHRLAAQTLNVLGLDFGGVDILRTPDNTLKVIEINTAPGIEGTTLQLYAEAFKKLVGTEFN